MCAGLCRRRHLSDPVYSIHATGNGFYEATVIVNGREYVSERSHAVKEAAQEDVAGVAWNIYRGESQNGGVAPGQGYPVGHRPSNASSSGSSDTFLEKGTTDLTDGLLCVCGRPYVRSATQHYGGRCADCQQKVRYL